MIHQATHHIVRATAARLGTSCVPTTIKVFSDASIKYGAWIDHTGRQQTFNVPEAFRRSTLASESFAAYRAVKAASEINNKVHLFCDNEGVREMLQKRCPLRRKGNAHINDLLRQLLSFMEENKTQLTVSCIPSRMNPADPISRGPPTKAESQRAKRKLDALLRLGFIFRE